jgi:hypothetical protein
MGDVPKDRIILEKESIYTGENARFTYKTRSKYEDLAVEMYHTARA